MREQNWHIGTVEHIARKLESNIHNGLSEKEATARRGRYGSNVLLDGKRRALLDILTAQFKSPLVFILFGAGIVTLFLDEFLNAVVISIALLINVSVGAMQEGRASRAFETLRDLQERNATVIRDGQKYIVDAKDLVPGDIIFIESGMRIPADARIIRATGLSANESALTGEWLEVEKSHGEFSEHTALTEQTNMLWMGTLAVAGHADAMVVSTGKATQMGHIAEDLGSVKEALTPIQKNIKTLARHLSLAVIGILILILILGSARGMPFADLFLIAVAMAVSVMPEGMPAAVTVVLALGMRKILSHGGLVRNLLAAETLGTTTVILTDKTGTLTMADMRVASIITYSSLAHIELHRAESSKTPFIHSTDEQNVLAMAVLTASGFVEGYDNALSQWVVRGRPVERALILAGLESGLKYDNLVAGNPLIDTIPFESARRYSASLRYIDDSKKKRVYFAGAPESLLSHSAFVYHEGKKLKFSKKIHAEVLDIIRDSALTGMRLVAVGYRDTTEDVFSRAEKEGSNSLHGIIFAGLIVIRDPIRADVKASIKEARGAGAKVIMITGDNEHTALRVSEETGIVSYGATTLTGTDIESMSDRELLAALKKVRVFARILPRQKMRIARVLMEDGEIVAMTGDGINDAPALRRANIGIALGSGTEVAKEASDLVLLDDTFSTIVRAIEEGRRALDNLKKIVAYLLSTSFTEVFLIVGALAVGAPLPLLPAQILWTNIVHEGFMNFSFAFEPRERGAMRRDPRALAVQRIVTSSMRALVIILSIVSGISLTVVYFIGLKMNMPLAELRTLMFVLLSIVAIFFTFSLKSLETPLWKINIFSNRYLLFALCASIFALFAALYVPALQTLLSLSPLPLSAFGIVLIVGVLNLLVVEIVKYGYFWRGQRQKESMI